MKAQTTIEKSPIPDAFSSKNADGDYLANSCFCERYVDDFSFHFTGKEKDSETGYSYFGARYLDHELMTGWLSVDPMADKYPSISPYAYCAWNPVKLVDPDGEVIDDYFSRSGKYLGRDNAETNNVRIIDEELWNQYSNEPGRIEHEIGRRNSSIMSESDISESASLRIYKFYWEKINSFCSNVNICAEKRQGKTGKHYMDAHTHCRTYINSEAKYTRTIYVDLDLMSGGKYSDNAYDIMSCFEHENRHLFQQSNAFQVFLDEYEYDALKTQVNSSTFEKCSLGYQNEIRSRLQKETPVYIKRICPDLY